MFKVKNRNTKTRCEICSKLTIKTPAWPHWRRSCVFVVNFEHTWHLVLMFLLLNWVGKSRLFWSELTNAIHVSLILTLNKSKTLVRYYFSSEKKLKTLIQRLLFFTLNVFEYRLLIFSVCNLLIWLLISTDVSGLISFICPEIIRKSSFKSRK